MFIIFATGQIFSFTFAALTRRSCSSTGYILPADEVLAVYPILVAFYILYFKFYLASDVVVA